MSHRHEAPARHAPFPSGADALRLAIRVADGSPPACRGKLYIAPPELAA